MEAPRRSWFDAEGLVIGGAHRLPFYAGALHYWRVPRARWAAALKQLAALGLTIVESYVPWRVHEPAPGKRTWDGDRDLPAFLAAAAAAGLRVALRPGPHINAELTAFGMPDHVLADPACQARTATGTPVWMPTPPRAWPVPSYASQAFRARVHDWYAAVGEVIAPYLAPDGPVVALGVDNEAQMFFRLGAYDHDYHPDAIAGWRASTGLDGEPPRAWDPESPARCISWLRWKDHYVEHALEAFARSLDAAGLAGIARMHNLPAGYHGDLRGVQRAIGGPVGIDAYTPRARFAALRERAIACAGNAEPLPLALEVGVGYAPWLPPLDAGDDPARERDQLLSLLAAGVRGFNLFMAVERDRFYGAVIDAQGRVTAPWVQTLIAALAEVDWPRLRRVAQVGVIASRADARFGHASCLLDPMTPVFAEAMDLGPGGAAELGDDPAAIAARRWHAALLRALELARVPYTILEDSVGEAELHALRAVIVPTLDRIDRGLQRVLRAVVEHPGKKPVVVIGPGAPTLDELGQPLADPLRRVGRLKAGSLDDVAGLAADLAALAEPTDWQIERPDDVHAYPHTDGTHVRVVFVASDADRPTQATLLTDEHARTLRDPFSHERIAIATGRATIALHARGVRMLVVER